MREILFRGKRVDNSEWVASGSLIHFNDEGAERLFFIPKVNEKCVAVHDTDDNITAFKKGTFYKVIPETIGQYTGLTNEGGDRIYEGDIVKVTDDDGSTDFSDGGVGVVEFYEGLWYVGGEVNNGLSDLTKAYYVEIIGNIHDNPELLGAQ